ncbi:multidrug effflux MFS transporter [Cryptosporangium aurantiacum]|uniref:MFS transporter, DHA1 family, bicyclomycin/chloramphenicol resistance protein n=1 Tax=Cryptosporangium aurantiacum TaxID=134849 RepID=A0A1M7RJI7_9ACTN|nr:multidrug effflux MFS transporter [Cryptosporangium aurantiacum]SHN46434.1 MFS transporter, DHA1 family, bicyclomycin/chloramphenicol resistance protein [Cryptosporangium aurantiacum]
MTSLDARRDTTTAATASLPLLAVLVLALLSAIAPLATDMYLPGFPTMADELRTDASSIQLTLTTFMAGLAIGQLVIGPLSDRWGRRRPLLIGAAVCIVASALCAAAPNVGALIAFRFLQGFAGAAGVVLGRAIVADTVRGAAAARIFSVLMTIGGIAPVVAPLLGGALLGPVGWRGVFGVLTVAAVVMLIGSFFVLRETLPASSRQRGGVSATLRGARTVLGNRRYVGYTLAFIFTFGTLFGYISASPFVLQTVFGLSSGWYSVAFAANAVGLTLGSLVNARVVGRFGARRMLIVGLGSLLTWTVVLAVLTLTGLLTTVGVLVLLWLCVTSVGLVMGNATSLAIAQTPSAAGTGSAVIGAGQFALAAVVSPLVGLGGEGTAVPMAIVMVVSAAVAVVALATLTREPQPGH